MKTKIRPYAEFLVRQNLSYIIAAVVLITASAALGFYLQKQVSHLDIQTKSLQNETAQLRSRRAAIRSVVGESSENLDNDLQLLSALIPDSEDYFSIITALETLSQRTGFRIDSYTINLQASTSTRLSLTVTGSGDNQAFLTFLQNYHINGGRLITAESIGIDPEETGSIRLDLNFYNKKASEDVATGSAPIVSSVTELDSIKSKITFSFVQNLANEQVIQDYPTKQDPF